MKKSPPKLKLPGKFDLQARWLIWCFLITMLIDELDAIGRQRGVHVGAVNDEREQTLNALPCAKEPVPPLPVPATVAAAERTRG